MISDTEAIWLAVAGQMTAQELADFLGQDLATARQLIAQFGGKRSKFNNQVVRRDDGLVFGSLMEERRYAQLQVLQLAGEIHALETQKAFLLQEAFRDNQGRHHRKIEYIVDFYYREGESEVAEDTKGHPTAMFRAKEKLFRVRYPHIELRILYDV